MKILNDQLLYCRIRRWMVLKTTYFAKLRGDLTKVIVILAKFTFFRKKLIGNKIWVILIFKVCYDEYLELFILMKFRWCKITPELSLLVEIKSKYSRSHKTVAQEIIITNYSIQNSINKADEKVWSREKSIRKWIQQLSELSQVFV